MKVKELINELKQYPEDLMVVISGYEDGVDELKSIRKVKIALNQHDEEYYGQHDIVWERNIEDYPKGSVLGEKETWDIEAVWI